MPNFNGAIIVHTLQLLKAPATLREIVVTIAKNTELSQDELKEPVKQTLSLATGIRRRKVRTYSRQQFRILIDYTQWTYFNYLDLKTL